MQGGRRRQAAGGPGERSAALAPRNSDHTAQHAAVPHADIGVAGWEAPSTLQPVASQPAPLQLTPSTLNPQPAAQAPTDRPPPLARSPPAPPTTL